MDTQSADFHMGRFLWTGALLALGLLLAYEWGVFESWRSIQPPPAAEYSFAGIYRAGYGTDDLVVRSADGKLFRCSGYNACQWRVDVVADWVVDQPCPARGLSIARLKQPFQEEVSCQRTVVLSEWVGGPLVTYVRDDQGRLWRWSQSNGGTLAWLGLPAILLGLTAGFLLALAWNALALALRPPVKPGHARWNAYWNWLEQAVRVGARVWSIFSVAVLLALYVAPGEYRQLSTLSALQLLYVASLWVGMAAMALAWRWEGLGAGLAMLSFATAVAGWVLRYPDELGIALAVLGLAFAPGLLFLAAWALKRRRTASPSALAPPTAG